MRKKRLIADFIHPNGMLHLMTVEDTGTIYLHFREVSLSHRLNRIEALDNATNVEWL